jgi:hypothetical protein
LYNHSFATCYLPSKFKDVRMVLLAKKNPICLSEQTRPISLLDSFLKVQERLFLTRFRQVLCNRGILPDNQSGFRPGHRLQTRVLLLIEQISSLMSNSSPVATVFVDFKSAFDQLWFEGCLGKLGRMGVPISYVNWIRAWLVNRRATIEIQGMRSRWIPIHRGGPQGSAFTPTLFITYHSDMESFIPMAMSFFFADDLAAVIAGRIGVRFTEQCVHLERQLHSFFDRLEFYAILSVQPINYAKTQCMFSARAILYPDPLPEVKCGGHPIEWTNSYKYLGYWFTTKLGWGNGIRKASLRIRQQTASVNSMRIGGYSSKSLRKVLFSTFVQPLWTRILALLPLMSTIQRANLNHLYYTSLKRVYRCSRWNDLFFAALFKERSLDDMCYSYWWKYLRAMANSKDGSLLLEQLCGNTHRMNWQEGHVRVRGMRRSKRFVAHSNVLGVVLEWMTAHGTADSVLVLEDDEFECFVMFPETF